MQDYNKAIEINPELAHAYFHRALSYKFITIEYNKAFEDFEKAIESSPTSIGHWISRAEAYWAKKEYKKAISDCNKAIEIDPEHAAEAYVMRDAIL